MISSSVQHPISLIFAIHVSFMLILLTKPMQKSVTTVCLHCSFARLKNKHIGVLGTNVATTSRQHWSPVSGYRTYGSVTPTECAVRASPKCSDPEPHTDRHSLVYHRLRTLAITSSLYGLKIIPKSVISLIDALFVFLRYTFFLIYIPAKIT